MILPPLSGKSGSTQALIFIPGAKCPKEQYRGHMQAIQEQTSFPIWIAVPHILDQMAIPVGTGEYIKFVKDELKGKGFTSAKFLFGGHSLGSVAIAKWTHSNIDQVHGLYVQGGYVSRGIADPARNFGAPVLTVSGEYDGWMASISRISLSFD